MKRLSEKLEKALNIQLNHEWDNSRLYYRFSQCLDFNGWFGAAKLFKKYSDEEMIHMNKIVEFLKDRDCNPIIDGLEAFPCDFKGIEDIVNQSYDREIDTSDRIKEIALSALGEKDLTTYGFLQWFVLEQIEEESKTLYWVDRIKMMNLNKVSLFFLDEEMEDKAI
jgi:ferritin